MISLPSILPMFHCFRDIKELLDESVAMDKPAWHILQEQKFAKTQGVGDPKGSLNFHPHRDP